MMSSCTLGSTKSNMVLFMVIQCSKQNYKHESQSPVNNASNMLIGVTTTCLLLNTLHITCNFKCSFYLPLHMMQGPLSKPGQADK